VPPTVENIAVLMSRKEEKKGSKHSLIKILNGVFITVMVEHLIPE
jgi:hypothetical protein